MPCTGAKRFLLSAGWEGRRVGWGQMASTRSDVTERETL